MDRWRRSERDRDDDREREPRGFRPRNFLRESDRDRRHDRGARRRRESHSSSDEDRRRKRTHRDRGSADDLHHPPARRGFKPAPWMAVRGPRPGQTKPRQPSPDQPQAAPNPPLGSTATERPEIQLCRMQWEDTEQMDQRVGGIIPQVSDVPLSQRFAVNPEGDETSAGHVQGLVASDQPDQGNPDAAPKERSEDVEARLQHLAQLHLLGVPIGLVSPELETICQAEAEKLPASDLNALLSVAHQKQPQHQHHHHHHHHHHQQHHRGPRWAQGRGWPHAQDFRDVDIRQVENHWPELPLFGMWSREMTADCVANTPSPVILVTLIPSELNTAEKLQGHFKKFGTVKQIIPRINFHPHPKFARHGLAVLEMGSVASAIAAVKSHEAVCNNRFIKVFHAPEVVRSKVEKMKVAKLMQERKQLLEARKERDERRQAAEKTLEAAKATVEQLMQHKKSLKAMLDSAPNDDEKSMVEVQLQEVTRAIKEALNQQLAAMEQMKQATQDAKAATKGTPTTRGVGFGAHSLDTRTSVFRLGALPQLWQTNPQSLRRAMERYGELVDVAVGGGKGYVRFHHRFEADRAVRALEAMSHKPEWLEREVWEREWPKEGQVQSTSNSAQIKGSASDDDEALVEQEMAGLEEAAIPRLATEEMSAGGEDAAHMDHSSEHPPHGKDEGSAITTPEDQELGR